MKLLLLLLLSSPLALPASRWHKVWRISQAALLSASIADAHSSIGGVESNPLLGGGQFGHRQTAIKFGVLTGSLIAQEIVARRYKGHDKPLVLFSVGNAAVAEFLVGVSIRNRQVLGGAR
jgi:hypothetical protein